MSEIKKLLAKHKAGELESTSNTGRPRVGEGKFLCKVVEARVGKNRAGTKDQGLLKMEVVEVIDGSKTALGGSFNYYYIMSADEGMMNDTTERFALMGYRQGVDADRVLSAKNPLAAAKAMIGEITIAADEGFHVIISRRESNRAGANGEPYMDNRLEVDDTLAVLELLLGSSAEPVNEDDEGEEIQETEPRTVRKPWVAQ